MKLKIENYSNYIDEIRIYSTDGAYVIYNTNTVCSCYANYKIMFYHEHNRNWLYKDSTGNYTDLGTVGTCGFNIPDLEDESTSILYIFDYGVFGDIFDLEVSDGWIASITPKYMGLSSNLSIRKALEGLRQGSAGLNKHRQNLLDKVPNTGDFASFARNHIEVKDLAYISAKVGHEFALLRSKKHDILVHGSHIDCDLETEFKEQLKCGKLRLVAHSHPDYDVIIPSQEDRLLLKEINQDTSIIISWYTGKQAEFSRNRFE